jgi:hypothetical protein
MQAVIKSMSKTIPKGTALSRLRKLSIAWLRPDAFCLFAGGTVLDSDLCGLSSSTTGGSLKDGAVETSDGFGAPAKLEDDCADDITRPSINLS